MSGLKDSKEGFHRKNQGSKNIKQLAKILDQRELDAYEAEGLNTGTHKASNSRQRASVFFSPESGTGKNISQDKR